MCSEMSRDFIKLMKNYYLRHWGPFTPDESESDDRKTLKKKNDKEYFLVRIPFRLVWMGLKMHPTRRHFSPLSGSHGVPRIDRQNNRQTPLKILPSPLRWLAVTIETCFGVDSITTHLLHLLWKSGTPSHHCHAGDPSSIPSGGWGCAGLGGGGSESEGGGTRHCLGRSLPHLTKGVKLVPADQRKWWNKLTFMKSWLEFFSAWVEE